MLHASSSVVLCRYVHQVTACALNIMKKQAYQQYVNTCIPRPAPSQELWERENETHPMFRFWNLIFYLELVLLEFVRSIRSGDFGLYIVSLKLIVPLIFSLDHDNYARWLPVHISEMDHAHKNHPNVHNEFSRDKFTVQKTNRKFSRIGLDHNQEQLNAKVKGVSVVIGLTEEESALRQWHIAGPEIARLLEEYEANEAEILAVREHHDSSRATQRKFKQDVKLLASAIEDLGNSFAGESFDLYALDTKLVTSKEAI